MPLYDFKCKICGKVKEIDKPVTESYVPECHGKPMNQVYSTPTIIAGKLNAANIPRG